MNNKIFATLVRNDQNPARPGEPRRPSSAGVPLPSSAGVPLPSSEQTPIPAGYVAPPERRAAPLPDDRKTPSGTCSLFDIGALDEADTASQDTQKKTHDENLSAAVRTLRNEANNLGGSASGSIFEKLCRLGIELSRITPFANEGFVSKPNAESCMRDTAEAEIDPGKWGASESGIDFEEALDNLDVILDPSAWGTLESPEESPDNAGLFINPTCLAARYEKEAEDARNYHEHHALNDISICTYNVMIRASNDVSLLWDGRLQADAYELAKTLIFRTVISNEQLGPSVLVAALGYLADIKSRAKPMIDLWHQEAGLELPAKR